MGNTRLITIICWAISALALLGLVVWALLGGLGLFNFGFSFGIGSFDIVGSHNVPADNIHSLDVDWTAGRVYIGTHTGNDIQITEFAQRNLRDGEELVLRTDSGTLAIQFAEHRTFRMNMPTKQLEILIPQTLGENFEDFRVNTVSGRVEVSDIEASDFVVSTTSGRVELYNITSQTLNASTTSGRIELSAVQAEGIVLRTVSGRITTINTETESLQTHTTSGRHELSGSFGEVNARSTSGRIEVTSRVVPERLIAHAVSGRIEVTVPNTEAISIQYSTRSGRFNSAIPVITHGGEAAQFDLSTTSGRISIYELR